MPKPYPATLKITQDGSPLEGASITLMPAEKGNSWTAGGLTDASGTAIMKTKGKYDGVVPGSYKILVTKRESDKSAFTAPDPEKDPEGYSKYMNESRNEKLASYDLIDPKFGSTSSTPETIDITEGKNEKTVDVGAAIREKRK